jgi:hypothetical protein
VGWANAGVSNASLFEIDPDIRPTPDPAMLSGAVTKAVAIWLDWY